MAAEKKGIPLEKLRGTVQNDILKEYTAQNEYIFPVEPSMRLVVDTIEYASQNLPRFNPVSVSGYHIREAGSTARPGIRRLRWPMDSSMSAPAWIGVWMSMIRAAAQLLLQRA